MPLKIFSKISDAVKGAEAAASNVAEKVSHVFNAGKAGIVENVNSFTHEGEVEVTVYTSYGYRQDGKWRIPLRGRVSQKRRLPDELIADAVSKIINCGDADHGNLISRSRQFTDDSRSGQNVTIAFGADAQFSFPTSDLNGLIEREIELTDEEADELLAAQGSRPWLTFNVVSEGHSGTGRVRLIEPEGLSVVSDIDDTIKVTLVPGDKDEVLRRTLCKDFEAAPGMAERYKNQWGGAAFHYVTGGPWQLFTPLDDFLIKGAGGFPDGSFHMTYHPKNFLAEDTREILIETILGSMGQTYTHKVNEISLLMRRFPGRKFVLVGDSGEVDPEVYRKIRDDFGAQVKEIVIRDVLDEANVNKHRLPDYMTLIDVEPPVCATDKHHNKLTLRFQELYDKPYARNTRPPCG